MKKEEDTRYKEKLKVLVNHSKNLSSISNSLNVVNQDLDNSVVDSEKLIESFNIDLSTYKNNQYKLNDNELKIKVQKKWEELITEVDENGHDKLDISLILSAEEISGVKNSLDQLRGDFKALNRLDKIDWAIAGLTGVTSALVDILLIQMPKRPGFLGEKAVKGGPLSNYIKETISNSLTNKEIRTLEQNNWVPYDSSHSKSLAEKVDGLGPRTHRFQTLGHDPILGFIFGVRDILHSEMTSIDKNGKLIIQSINSEEKNILGMNIFEAIVRVFGHLKSDICTKSGIPAPLMPLIQLLQIGEFGKQKYTIGQISRSMYASGYDFSHFLSMSIPVLIIEVLVRILYLIKNLNSGKSLTESIPIDTLTNKKPKLQTMLFTAHLFATTANAGKVYLTQSPLAINYPQWIIFAKYSFKQIKWNGYDKSYKMNAYVQKHIDDKWNLIHLQLDQLLESTEEIIYL